MGRAGAGMSRSEGKGVPGSATATRCLLAQNRGDRGRDQPPLIPPPHTHTVLPRRHPLADTPTLPNPRAPPRALQLLHGALSAVTLCPLRHPEALVLGADRGASFLASSALLATQQCLDCGLWTLEKTSEWVSNPVVAQGEGGN